ncbi:MAG: SRPBCC domain-containing protein [Vicinamibacterales bacterium]
MTADGPDDQALRATVIVRARVADAFAVFTEGVDTWWPRSHHIGPSRLTRAVIDTRVGGRAYGTGSDGVEHDWGTVLTWSPPHRLTLAWQIDAQWQYEPDLAKASEVDLRFTDAGDERTRVELVHRHFERHGPGGRLIRHLVGASNGWPGLLRLFSARAARFHPVVAPLAFIFATNDGLIARTLDRVTDDDFWRRPSAAVNPLGWLVGHIVHTRATLVAALGDGLATGWGAVFDRGAALQASSTYPRREAIDRVRLDVETRLRLALADLDEARLAGPAAGIVLPGVQTIADLVACHAFHDAYHVGQLGAVRKMLGLSSLTG